MDLNTIVAVKRPASADEITEWPDGHAWLAGGTWLFFEPQLKTDTLVDLGALHWPSLQASAGGLDIAATCRIVELDRFKAPAAWTAAPLFRECCRRSWRRSRSGTKRPWAETSAGRCRPAR